MHVSVKPKHHTHKECGQRFHPLLHTAYTADCLTAPLGEDVSLGHYDCKKASNSPGLCPVKGQKPRHPDRLSNCRMVYKEFR